MNDTEILARGGASHLLVRPSNPDMMRCAPLHVDWKEALGPRTAEISCLADDAAKEASTELTGRIDFSQLDEIFENFLEVTGLPIAVIDLAGEVLASSRWQRLCVAFHRVHPDTLAGCVMSDTMLSRQLSASSDCAIYRCANGLTDCATPIVVDGMHVANLFTGQFLMEQPDMAFFRLQQERCGFDEKAYFEALVDIPIVSERKIPAVLKLLRGLAQQIAQQSLANAKLQMTTRMLQTVVNTVPQHVFWKDRHSRFLGCNQAVAQMAGVASPREMVGKSDYDLPWRQLAHLYRADDAEVMETGIGKRNIIEPVHMGDGTVRWMETSKVPLLDAQGKIFGVLGTFQDVTERKETEAALKLAKETAENANNAKSRFLAAASHDLRQPLSALSIYVGLLKDKLAVSDQPLLANLQNCVYGLSTLLNDLLDLSKLQAGVVMPHIDDFDADEMLARLVSTHAPEAKLKRLQLRLRNNGIAARTDPVLFARIVGNLIANAVRFTNRGGVLVSIRRRAGRAWVEVWDTGIGIPADKIHEIFDEFKQLGDESRNRGSGLGLAIVAKATSLLDLRMRVESRPGKGSMFAVELPLGQARAPAVPRHVAATPRNGRVAIVEDNDAVRLALICALRNVGHEVVAAASGTELLACLGDKAPDALISDYRLAGNETGFDVVLSARRVFGDGLPAIIITGDTDPDLLRTMADHSILIRHKPVDLESLLAWIHQAISD